MTTAMGCSSLDHHKNSATYCYQYTTYYRRHSQRGSVIYPRLLNQCMVIQILIRNCFSPNSILFLIYEPAFLIGLVPIRVIFQVDSTSKRWQEMLLSTLTYYCSLIVSSQPIFGKLWSQNSLLKRFPPFWFSFYFWHHCHTSFLPVSPHLVPFSMVWFPIPSHQLPPKFQIPPELRSCGDIWQLLL